MVTIKGVEKEFDFSPKDFIPLVKLHIENKLTHSVAVHQILNTYPMQGMKKWFLKEAYTERE